MRRFFRRVTVALTGALVSLTVLLLALLLLVAPGVPAVARPSAPVVEGVVLVGAEPVAGVQVGFWRADGTRLALTRSAADGGFRLRVPSGATGFLAVGSAPTSPEAVFAAAGRHLVRSVVGSGRPAPVAALTRPVPVGALAGRGRTAVRLQQAGRLTGTSAKYAGTGEAQGEVHLMRTNGSEVDVASATADGAVATSWVVPGRYDLQLVPQSPYLPRTVQGVRVPAGASRAIDMDAVTRGAVARGTITVGGRPATERMSVRVRRDGVDVDAVRSDEQGRWALPGLAPGTYTIRFGSRVVDPDADAEGAPPAATAESALPASARLRMGSDDRILDVDLRPAGSVTGRSVGAPGARVVLQSSSGRVLRVEDAADGRTFSLGGLVPGRAYRLVALGDGSSARFGTASFTATDGATPVGDIELARRTTVLRGSVDGATGGTVLAETAGSAATPPLSARIGADGSYRLPGLTPGRWRVRAEVPGHLPGTLAGLTIGSRASARLDPVIGSQAAAFRAVFRAGVPGVRIDGEVVDADGYRVAVSGPEGDGRVAVGGLRAGRYRFAGFDRTVPTRDGPWWFAPPRASFTLTPGRTTDIGAVPLRIRAG